VTVSDVIAILIVRVSAVKARSRSHVQPISQYGAEVGPASVTAPTSSTGAARWGMLGHG
jgi:hypothetical protein